MERTSQIILNVLIVGGLLMVFFGEPLAKVLDQTINGGPEARQQRYREGGPYPPGAIPYVDGLVWDGYSWRQPHDVIREYTYDDFDLVDGKYVFQPGDE